MRKKTVDIVPLMVLFLIKDKTQLYLCPKGKEGTYEIPEGTLSIEDDAFKRCSKMSDGTLWEGQTAL
mgnify:CR=1 FL=1